MNNRDSTRPGHDRIRARLNPRTLLATAATAAVLLGLAPMAYAQAPQLEQADTGTVPACVPRGEQPPTQPPPSKPTSVTTIQQAYECILAHHYSGPILDHRALLTSAFANLTTELRRRGIDQAVATLPRLTGDRARDWSAFAKVYQAVVAALPADPHLGQALARVTIQAMVDTLRDNHNSYIFGPIQMPDFFRLGFTPAYGLEADDVRDSTAPMYVASTWPNSPAARGGLKPGDIIEAVDGIPVFINGRLTAGVLELLRLPAGKDTIKVTVRRPATNQTWTVELNRPTSPPEVAPVEATVTLRQGGIAYVNYPTFDPELADQVLAKIAELRAGTTLRGIILDVRGNDGGREEAVAKRLGAFIHGKVWAWNCDAKDRCTPNRTDDSVALLNLPLVVLTDGKCRSACDAFSAGVRDLKIGTLVGARTGGVVSGLPTAYTLEDGSGLALTAKHHFGPNREVIDGIGVAVDHQAPTTAEDLSAGRDAASDKAMSLLTS